jgi:hypothetical protein
VLLLRRSTRTVYNVPFIELFVFVFMTMAIADNLPLTFRHGGVVFVWLVVLLAFAVPLSSTSRRDSELITRSCWGRKRWSASHHALRVYLSEPKLVVAPWTFRLELVNRHGNPGTATLAVVIANARNREKIKAAAEVLDVPLLGSFDPPSAVVPPPHRKGSRKLTRAARRHHRPS